MDPELLAIILFHHFSREIFSLLCLSKGIYLFLMLFFTKFISLDKAGIKLAQT
jgi:hypothetical protein